MILLQVSSFCPYIKKCDISVPLWSPSFELLPDEVQSAFRKTFDYTEDTVLETIKHRTSTKQWMKILYHLAKVEPNENLRTCYKNKFHVYPAHNSECPWCKMELQIKNL